MGPRIPEVAFAPLLVASLTVLLAWAAAQGAPRARTAGPNLAAIDAYVEATLRADRVPGAALVIVHRDRVVHLRGFGRDGRGRAVTPQTSFLLGSMSKSFTALAVMQLVERGRVDLGAPVRRYLPWFRVVDPGASEAITVAQALAHTTGIPTRAPRAREPATLEDQVRALSRVRLSHPPGNRYEYASPNYLILGAIIERVSGQSYGDFLRQNIFAPLDMRHSFTSQEEAWRSGMSSGHRYWFGFPVPARLPYEADRLPTATVISSAGDLGHYLIAQLNGGRYAGRQVLSAPGVARMHRGTVAAPGENFRYAMGWREGPVDGVPAVHHGGILPHFRGKMVLLPEVGWGVAVLTNVSTALPLVPTSHRLADDIAASLAGVPLPGPSRLFQWVYWAITAGVVLSLLGQVRALLGLRAWLARARTRPRRAVWGEIASDLLALPVALLVVPLLVGLPLAELLRSLPDLMAWLLLSLVLGVAGGVVKVWLVARGHVRPARRP